MRDFIDVLLYVFSCLLLSHNCFAQPSIAYYNFNNSFQDMSGNNNHGKGFGAVSFSKDRFGNDCSAISLNGNDAYVEVPHSPIFDNIKKEFSVSCWFKIKNTSTNSMRWLTILCKGDNANETINNPHFRLQTFQGDKQSTISINTDFTEYDTDFINHLIEFDKWYFYCITYDGQHVNAYLNEQLIWKFPYNKELMANTSSLYIGKDAPGSMELFNGDLDELQIFNYVLSENEIVKIKRLTDVGPYLETFELNCPKNSVVSTTKSMCYSKVDFENPTISSNCFDVKLKQLKGLAIGSNFPLGNTTIVFQADSKNNEVQTCVSNVIVIDNEAPVFYCPRDTIIMAPKNVLSVKYNYSAPGVSDNCKIKKVWLDGGLASGEEFPLGITKIIYKAIDEHGNTGSCIFNVSVVEENKLNLKDDAQDRASKIANTTLGDIYHEHAILTVDSCIITIQIYDNGEEDNDTISVFYNTEEIQTRSMLKLKVHGTIIKILKLNKGVSNELVFRAWNTGSSGLNTMKVEFYYGDLSDDIDKLKKIAPFTTKEFNSKPGLSSAILLRYK